MTNWKEKHEKHSFSSFPEKRTYNGLPDFMTKVAREELNKLQASIKECNVIYLPQVNYLNLIPMDDVG